MKESPSVLIIQTAFIGDVILATAMIESIRAARPGALIDFVVRKGNEELLAGNPNLREVFILDKSRKYGSLVDLVRQFRSRKYDYLINVQRFATTGLMTLLSGAAITIGFDKNPLSFLFSRRVKHDIGASHEVERNQKLLETIGINNKARPKLFPSAIQLGRVKGYKSDAYITVSPASVWFTKQWPAEKWIELLNRIGSYKIYFLGGPGDVAVCDGIASMLKNRQAINLSGKLSLLESASLMKDAKMNFVNDSAPLHLASAMNAPVAAVFCSTVPSFGFGPLSDKSFIVETKETLDCRPCGLHGFRQCPKGHFRCATGIDSEQLLAAMT